MYPLIIRAEDEAGNTSEVSAFVGCETGAPAVHPLSSLFEGDFGEPGLIDLAEQGWGDKPAMLKKFYNRFDHLPQDGNESSTNLPVLRFQIDYPATYSDGLPSGAGKTEMVGRLGEALFGQAYRAEVQLGTCQGLYDLMGTPLGIVSARPSPITAALMNRGVLPVVLAVNEVEKASHGVQNAFAALTEFNEPVARFLVFLTHFFLTLPCTNRGSVCDKRAFAVTEWLSDCPSSASVRCVGLFKLRASVDYRCIPCCPTA